LIPYPITVKDMDESEVSVPKKADLKEGPIKPFHGWRRLPPERLVPPQMIDDAEEVEDEERC
jgi:hypothetical protein